MERHTRRTNALRLDDTLVVWTSEFGRSPWPDSPKRRSDHKNVYSSRIAEDGVHVHDLHATILQSLGFDHKRLTFRHAARDFRLTDVAGNVVQKLLA
jgi:hypothetical protein